MDGGSSRRSVRILAKVRRDIDSFLDPSVLSLVDHEAQVRGHSAPGESTALLAAKGNFDRNPRAGPQAECSPELLALRCKSEDLQSELEDAKCEARVQQSEWERRAERDAATLAKVTGERDGLQRDVRLKKRRLNEVESKLACAEREKETLRQESKDSVARCDLLRKDGSAERQQLQAEVSRLQQELSASRSARAESAGETVGVTTPAVDAEALRQRVEELEHETSSLRLALQQAQPESDVGAQLRKRHMEYEEELRTAREVRKELKDARAKVLKLEHEVTGLRAALDARDTALREAEEAVHSASLSKRDLDAFAATAKVIIEESEVGDQGKEAGTADVQDERATPSATPLELGLAWARFQVNMRSLRHSSAELQQRLDQVVQQEQGAQVELSRLRGDLAIAQARAEELQVDARRAQDECANHAARVSVLRDAITRGAGLVKDDSDSLRPELEAARKHVEGLEGVIKAKECALSQVAQELETLRKDSLGLADAQARATRLEQVNSELWNSNRSLQRQQERLVLQCRTEDGGFRAGTTGCTGEISSVSAGVLDHGKLLMGGDRGAEERGSDAAAAVVCADGRILRKESELASGLNPAALSDPCFPAVLELDRFRKATRKFVQEFREGLYGLLGWKVEMRAKGSTLQWHLTSRFSEGRSLIFVLRPAEAGRPAQFDLLATPWGEELQSDRQAMAFLEVYGSIPGFLAQVTTNSLTRASVPE